MPQKISVELLASDAQKTISLQTPYLFIDVSDVAAFSVNGDRITDGSWSLSVGVTDGVGLRTADITAGNLDASAIGGSEFNSLTVKANGFGQAAKIVVSLSLISTKEAFDNHHSRIIDSLSAKRYKGELVLSSSEAGSDSGWIPASPSPERFGVLLTGSSAVVSITGSDDAASIAAGYAVTITMDTAGSTFVTPPMNFDYKFIKFTLTSLGPASSIKVSRGV